MTTTKVKNYNNVTKYWIDGLFENKADLYPLRKGQVFIYKDKEYVFDGKKIKYSISQKEENFAKWISTKKKCVFFNPTINSPEGISTADLTINNDLYDMKIISGKSSQILYHNIRRKQRQSNNFLFEATPSPLTIDELKVQIEYLFCRKDMYFVNYVGVKKNQEFVIFKRK